jgi:hypothetical protein
LIDIIIISMATIFKNSINPIYEKFILEITCFIFLILLIKSKF